MQAVWAYSVLVFCLTQFDHLGHAVDEIPQEERQKWANLMHNMVHLLYRQRNKGDNQFAFLVVGKLQDKKKAPESIVLERWKDVFHNGTTKYTISNTLDQKLSQEALKRNDGPGMRDIQEQLSPKLRGLYVNYVAASVMQKKGETEKQHTEPTLLAELDFLCNAYQESKGYEPNFVLLYTWIFPCADPDQNRGNDTGGCTVKIIRKRRSRQMKTTWIVGYTTNGFFVDRNNTNKTDTRQHNMTSTGNMKNKDKNNTNKTDTTQHYMTPTGNKKNNDLLIESEISVIQVPCTSRDLHRNGNNGITIKHTNKGQKARNQQIKNTNEGRNARNQQIKKINEGQKARNQQMNFA